MTPEIPLGWSRVESGFSQASDQYYRFPFGNWDYCGQALAGFPHSYFRLLVRPTAPVHDPHHRCRQHCKPCADEASAFNHPDP